MYASGGTCSSCSCIGPGASCTLPCLRHISGGTAGIVPGMEAWVLAASMRVEPECGDSALATLQTGFGAAASGLHSLWLENLIPFASQ